MSRVRLLLGIAAGLLFAISVVAILRFGRTQEAPPPVLADLPAFALLDQNGAKVGRDDLRGQVHVVNFIFTSCPTSCPMLTAHMKSLGEKLTGAPVGFVSVTVDPKRDTPAVLRSYGEKYGASAPRWRFLTGDVDAVSAVVVRGFLTAMGPKVGSEDAPDIFSITHGEQFVILDRQGRLRAFRPAKSPEDLDRIAVLARALAEERS